MSLGNSRYADISNLTQIFIGFIPASSLALWSFILEDAIPIKLREILVFLKLKHSLPSYSAFTEIAQTSDEIDIKELKRKLKVDLFPIREKEQNLLWRQLYETENYHPSVSGYSKKFLFLRDATGLSFFWLLIGTVITSIILRTDSLFYTYEIFLLFQFLLIRWTARNVGRRLVFRVLQRASLKPLPKR